MSGSGAGRAPPPDRSPVQAVSSSLRSVEADGLRASMPAASGGVRALPIACARLAVVRGGQATVSNERLLVQRHLSIASLLAFGVVVLATLPGCTAKAGDACTKGTASCADASNELTCQDGKLIQAPCRGPKGCAVAAEKLTCDIAANKAGDVCSTDDEGNTACSADGKSVVACKKGKYVVDACGGPGGCKTKDGKYECDRSIAPVGQDCDSGHACAPDGKQLLECKGGKFVFAQECKGEKGCKVEGDKINCDAEAAAPAAPADSAAPAAGAAPGDAPPAAAD